VNILNNLAARFDQLFWRNERAKQIEWQKSRGLYKGYSFFDDFEDDRPLDFVELKELDMINDLLRHYGLRRCALCNQANEQGYICRMGDHWAHIDCAAEYNQSLSVDPTTQLIGESETEYRARMKKDFPEFSVYEED